MADAPDTPEAGSRRWVFAIPLAMFAVLAAIFLGRLFAGDPSRVPSALIGRPAPAAPLPPVAGMVKDGQPVPGLDLASLKGKAVILNVFGSWCPPCREEHPLLNEMAKAEPIRAGRVVLAGFNYKDEPENARRFLGALGNPFSVIGADRTGRMAIDWGVYGAPETFVIGPDGTIRHKHIGPLSPESAAAVLKRAEEALAR